jgi:hypothetical protein
MFKGHQFLPSYLFMLAWPKLNIGATNSVFDSPTGVLAPTTHFPASVKQKVSSPIHFHVFSNQFLGTINSFCGFTNAGFEDYNSFSPAHNSGFGYHNSFYDRTKALYPLHQLWF